MKFFGTIVGLLLFTCLAYGQLINPDFEEWDGNDPVGWTTYNILVEAVEPSDNAYSGNFAARLMITEDFEVSPLMQTTGAVELDDAVTLSVNFAALTEGVELSVTLGAFVNGQPVDGAGESTMEANPQYQLFSLEWAPMVDRADSILVMISLQSDEEPMAGTVLVDNVVMQGVNPLAVQSEPVEPVLEWRLDGAFPNPFNSTTTISFSIPEFGPVELAAYNLLGQRVVTITDGIHAPGSYRQVWNGTDDRGAVLPTGVYLVQLTASGRIIQTRVVLLK